MMKVRRGPAPAFLQSEEVREAQRRLLAHLHLPDVQRRQLRPRIEDEILYDPRVVEPLREVFGGLCAYCEQSVPEGGLHHHRPLFSVDTQDKDYYAWLAYEWRNLLLVCSECSKRSADMFPISAQRGQYLALIEDLRAQEAPLLIDPTYEAPTKHFEFLFNGEVQGETPRGEDLVQFLDLNRRNLVAGREQVLSTIVRGWESAVENGDERKLSEFFDAGPFLGARVSLMRRALKSVGLPPGGVGLGARTARRHILSLLRNDELRSAMALAIQRVLTADSVRTSLERPAAPRTPQWRAAIDAPPTAVEPPQHLGREIASVAIRNLKAIDELNLTLSELRERRSGATCLMLLGENAVGKSTTLCGIALALIGTKAARQLRRKASDLARSVSSGGWDQSGAPKVEVEVRFHGAEAAAAFSFDPANRRINGSPEPATLVLGYGARRRFKRGATATGWHSHVRSLFDPDAAIPHPGAWLATLSPARFEVVARALRSVLPGVDDDVFTQDAMGNVLVSAHGQPTPIDHLSEGYQSMFILVVDIIKQMLTLWANLEQARGVVLIDEIETHLHPRWKLGVMRALRSAMPRVQFIVTTHDPLCLRGMDNGEVVVLERDEDRRIYAVSDLPDVEGMRAEQLLTSEYFGLWSTVDEGVEYEMGRYAAAAARAPILPDASALVKRLTLGDTAQEQILNAALQKYLEDRDRPRGDLATSVREEAVDAVLRALKGEAEPGALESEA